MSNQWSAQQGTSKRFNGYRWTMWLFILISLVLAFVALHTAQPLQCRDIVEVDNSYTGDKDKICEVIINE